MHYEDVKDLNERLDECETLAEIFELVKQSVRRILNRHIRRARTRIFPSQRPSNRTHKGF